MAEDRSAAWSVRLRIAAAWPFYVIGTAFVIVADWLDPRPEGPNG